MIRVHHPALGWVYDSRCNRCAEAHCIDSCIVEARKKGVANHKMHEWVKRKVSCIHITRMRKDGTPGCSVPCVFCRRLLIAFDLRVVCRTEDGDLYKGKMDAYDAPASKLTSGQRARFGSKLIIVPY